MLKKWNNKKTAQEIQDDIFRKMSADQKLTVGATLWKMAKNIVGDKIVPLRFTKHR